VPACANIRQVIDAAAVALAEAGVGSPRTDAELLAAYAAATDRGRLASLTPDPNLRTLRRARRAARQAGAPGNTSPVPAAFGPVTVHVGPGVFIPRPETESLLEWAVAHHSRGTRDR